METKYDGYTIKYLEEEDKFVSVVDGEGTFEAKTLKLLKAKLDKIGCVTGKVQQTQKGITAEIGWSGNYVQDVIIGKFGTRNPYGSRIQKSVWITEIIPADNKYKQRENRRRIDVDSWGFKYYYDTPKNRALLEEQIRLVKETKALEQLNSKKISAIEKKLEKQKIKASIADEDLPHWDK